MVGLVAALPGAGGRVVVVGEGALAGGGTSALRSSVATAPSRVAGTRPSCSRFGPVTVAAVSGVVEPLPASTHLIVIGVEVPALPGGAR